MARQATRPSGNDPRAESLRVIAQQLARLERDARTLGASADYAEALDDMLRQLIAALNMSEDDVATLAGEVRRARQQVADGASSNEQLRRALRALQQELEQRRRDLQERDRMNELRWAHASSWAKTLGGFIVVLFFAWLQDWGLGVVTWIESKGLPGMPIWGVIATIGLICLSIWLIDKPWWKVNIELGETAVPPDEIPLRARTVRGDIETLETEIRDTARGIPAIIDRRIAAREAGDHDAVEEANDALRGIEEANRERNRDLDEHKQELHELTHRPRFVFTRALGLTYVILALLVVGWYDLLNINGRFGAWHRMHNEPQGWWAQSEHAPLPIKIEGVTNCDGVTLGADGPIEASRGQDGKIDIYLSGRATKPPYWDGVEVHIGPKPR